jgi:serine/threonine protein phosphatase PrpC
VQNNLQALLYLQYSVKLPPILTTRPRDRKKNEKIETDSFDRE